jgi:hypothetical protein
MRPKMNWIGIGLLCALPACGPSDLLGPQAAQGIEGLVLLGPQCPVQTQADPCPDVPYRAWIDVRTGRGAQVTRVRSDAEGRFRVGLRAGSYVLEPEAGSPFPVAGAQTVEVDEGAYTDVIVSFDTGIR